MTSEMTPKFSAEELHGCKNWLLPDVSSDKILPSAEKEALDEKEKNKTKAEKKASQPAAGESIEVIEESPSPVTAEKLQAITEAAEKEGYDSGYQKGLEQGQKEGSEKGQKAGFESGLEQSKATVAAQCEQLQHIIDALMIPLESEQKQLQEMILNMVASLTKAVVQRELEQDSSHITQLVDDALNIIPVGADKFSLFLNSQDINIVEKHLAYFDHSEDKHLTLHIDDSLLPGGCRLETQQTVVDYTVEQRLQKVIEGFLHKRFANHEDDEIESENNKALLSDSATPENSNNTTNNDVVPQSSEPVASDTVSTLEKTQAENVEASVLQEQEPKQEQEKDAAEQQSQEDKGESP